MSQFISITKKSLHKIIEKEKTMLQLMYNIKHNIHEFPGV